MTSEKERRGLLIDELATYFVSSLALYSTEQLLELIDNARGSQKNLMQQAHAVKTPNRAAIVVINPMSSKEELVNDLRELTDLIEAQEYDLALPSQVDSAFSDAELCDVSSLLN